MGRRAIQGLTAKWLREQLEAHKNVKDMAREKGCSEGVIYKFLSIYHLQSPQKVFMSRHKGSDGRTVEFRGVSVADLVKEYETNTVTLDELGDKYGVSRETIRNLFKEYKVRRPTIKALHDAGVCDEDIAFKWGYTLSSVLKVTHQGRPMGPSIKFPECTSKEWFNQKYHKEDMTQEDIANMLGASLNHVQRWMRMLKIKPKKQLGLRKRSHPHSYPILQNKAWLQKQRLAGKTCREIAAQVGCRVLTVFNALRRLSLTGQEEYDAKA